MKDNVITLNQNVKCYVLDELTYKNKTTSYFYKVEIYIILIKQYLFLFYYLY